MISVGENQGLHRNAPGEVMPREQMENVPDPTRISDVALLAILLKAGAPGLNVMDLSKRILEAFGSLKNLVSGDWCFLESRIEDWNNAHPDRPIKGVGHVKCLELAAAFEIARRWDRLSPETIKKDHCLLPRRHTVSNESSSRRTSSGRLSARSRMREIVRGALERGGHFSVACDNGRAH